MHTWPRSVFPLLSLLPFGFDLRCDRACAALVQVLGRFYHHLKGPIGNRCTKQRQWKPTWNERMCFLSVKNETWALWMEIGICLPITDRELFAFVAHWFEVGECRWPQKTMTHTHITHASLLVDLWGILKLHELQIDSAVKIGENYVLNQKRTADSATQPTLDFRATCLTLPTQRFHIYIVDARASKGPPGCSLSWIDINWTQDYHPPLLARKSHAHTDTSTNH